MIAKYKSYTDLIFAYSRKLADRPSFQEINCILKLLPEANMYDIETGTGDICLIVSGRELEESDIEFLRHTWLHELETFWKKFK